MKNHIKTDYDLIIAGAGPAGLTASIYAGRAGLNVLILEKEAPGGKVIKTGEIENYPGFTMINGPDLAMKFYEQAMAMGANLEYSGLKEFKKDEVFYVSLENGKEVTSKALIIATGTKENLLGVPGEIELYGKGVSYCAVCDGSFYKEMPVAVVGGGYSAVEEAIFLTRFASKVYLVHRRQDFRVDHKTLNKAKNNEKIEFILDTVVEKINGSNKVESIDIKNTNDNSTQNIKVDAIFPFIGQYPITHFIKQAEILNDEKHIKADENMKTAIEGLFTAGDVRNTPFRQIATAVADGALAGQNAVTYIENLE
ncbi:thioredoxin-disulfide reductase [Spiroplasma culicicola]|uniref:Thioredoxin reductase n=1 Tax=Spiroplasma culicicola AES-1 TaxID=1276246 RepID=W6A650_9MOLU|nr:thioredoxin-disulfide reductase [Spiroplasma culicicola]AHI52421.1 thioredoxin reductase [Spiroplasma culicicola AES-1]